jgi:hypothetical protein
MGSLHMQVQTQGHGWCCQKSGGRWLRHQRYGLRAGMPDAEFKGEDMEAATRKLESLPLLVSYQYTVKFDKNFKTIVILTI